MPQRQTLIEVIAAGYRSINRQPWLIGIPALLNLYLWWSAPLHIGSSWPRLQSWLAAGARMISGDRRMQEALVQQIVGGDARLQFAWLNLVPVWAPGVGRTAHEFAGPWQLLAALLLINGITLFLSGLFLAQLAAALQDNRLTPVRLLKATLVVLRRILLALLALLGIGLLLALPFLAISLLLIAAVPGAALPVLIAWYIVLFWAYVYIGLTPEAIVLSQAGPLRAIYNSVNIVRRDLGGTLGLLFVSYVIANGLTVVWYRISDGLAGLIIAIVGSAYIGSGLSAARLMFYQERLRHWRSLG
ncbi:MAG: hypothetical protein HC822_02730 [Oscillochloris sp.]|nr:hypothetical protein [Oscillochloris sp.]